RNPTALFRHLNPHCTHLQLFDTPIEASHLHDSLNRNPRFFEQLTYLNLMTLSDIEAFHLLCEHATILSYLNVCFEAGVRMHNLITDSFFISLTRLSCHLGYSVDEHIRPTFNSAEPD